MVMLQLRGKTGSPHKGDGTLSQSSEESFEAVLARLKTNRCVHVIQPVHRMPYGYRMQQLGWLISSACTPHLAM